MTRAQLIAAVPVRMYADADGRNRTEYIRRSDIPQPYREAFDNSLVGAQIPGVPGEPPRECIYATDWKMWLARRPE